jgi:gliding motility-associated-like protein
MKKLLFLIVILFSLVFANNSKAQITAAFVASNGLTFPIDTCGNLILTLNNTSTGNYDTAKWSIYYSPTFVCNNSTSPIVYKFFGATKSSSPIVAAVNPGSYYVCLTISNAAGQVNQICKCIASTHSTPKACFTASDTIGCNSFVTTITPCNPASTPPYTYTWNLGTGTNPAGGNYSTQQTTTGTALPGSGSIAVKYTCNPSSSAKQNVYLQVTDANGCRSAVIKTNYMNPVCNPNATISISSGNLCAPGTVTLGANTGSTSYKWWIPATASVPQGPFVTNTISQNFPAYGCTDVKVAVYNAVNASFGCSDTTTVNNAVCIQGIASTPCPTLSVSTTSTGSGQQFTVSFSASSIPISASSFINGILMAVPCNGSYPIGCVNPIQLGTISSVGGNVGTASFSINLPSCIQTPVTYCIGFRGDSIINAVNGCATLFTPIACAGSSNLQITINPCPKSNITLAPGYVSSYCTPSHDFVFYGPQQNFAPNLPGATYQWYTTNPASGGTVIGTGDTILVNFSGYTTPHSIWLKVTQPANKGGCSTTSVSTVTLKQLSGSFSYNKTKGCDTLTVNFKATSFPFIDTLYTWWFGDGTVFKSHDSTATHLYASNIDTCYTVKMAHRSYTSKGVFCSDTITQTRVIHIGHKVQPKVTLSDSVLCLKNGSACLFVNPDPITQVVPIPGAYVSLCNFKSCQWYFTRPHKTPILAQSRICDTPKVCFSDTGVYSGHFVINSNGCVDTLTIDSLVTVNGIKSDFKDSVWCTAGGGLSSQTCTFIPKVKIYPKNGTGSYPTTVEFIMFGAGPGGTDAIYSNVYWPASSPNTPHSPVRITHSFPSNGVFTVWMIVSNSGQSCQPDTVKKTVSILTLQSVLQLVPFNAPTSICLNSSAATWTFNGLASTPNSPYPPVVVIDNGDGTDTTFTTTTNNNFGGGILNNLTHTYDSCGTFKLKLIVSNNSGSCKDSSELFLNVSEIYQAGTTKSNPRHRLDLIQLVPDSGSCGQCSKFINKIAVCNTTLLKTVIDFADGSKRDTLYGNWANFTHCFLKQPGNNFNYWVFDNNGCMQSGTIGSPVFCGNKAKITGLPDSVLCLAAQVNIQNVSTGVVSNSTWTWDNVVCKSGHALDSSTRSTKSSYSLPPRTNGYYYLNLRVANYCVGTGSVCASDTCVRIHFQDPTAIFTVPLVWPCPSSFLPVTNQSTGAYDSLVIVETIPGVTPPLQFTYTKRQGGIPKSFQLPTGAVGIYDIKFYLYSNSGALGSACQSLYSTVSTVLGPTYKPLPLFKQHACLGDTIWFNDSTNSSNGILAVWNDASAPIQIPRPNPSDTSSQYYHFGHPFNVVGAYPVYFFITDGSNCSYPFTDSVFIDGPKASFKHVPNISNFCGTASIQFQNTSVASSVSILDTGAYEWNIFDVNTNAIVGTYTSDTINVQISTPGAYSVQLKIKSKFGCVDSLTKSSLFTVHPKPVSTFNASDDSICIGSCISFINTSTDPEPNLSYHWYFDWPSKTINTTLTSTSHCFNTAGTYQVVLIDSSTTFCVDTSSIHTVYVSPDVIASFTVPKTVYCGDSATVTFTSTSTPTAELRYCWDFGDGALGCQSTIANPTHKFYLANGANSTCFIVKLVVSNASGCDSIYSQQICLYPSPHAAFDLTPPGACNPIQVTFQDLSTTTAISPITNYNISWGYNSSNYPTGIKYTFTHNGAATTIFDTVVYIVTTSNGCMDTATKIVSTYPIPIACVALDTLVCGGQQVSLGCAPVVNHSYNWYSPFGTTFKPDRFNANPIIQPQIDTTYCMQVSNQFGCSDTACVDVHIISFIVPTAGVDTSICIGGSAMLTAQGGITYSWLSQLTGDIVSTKPSFVVTPAFPATYTYTATINGTCNSDAIDVSVTVFPLPNVVLNHDINDIVAGHPVKIPEVGAAGGFYTYLWQPNYRIDSITSGSPTVSPDVTTKYTVILTDIHGCADTSDVTIHVLCNASNSVYVPNAFIPGSSAQNSRFYIQGTGISQLNYVRIYDRWGGLVYSADHQPINDNTQGWDGFFNGQPMPSGVFMYQIEVQCAEGEVFPLTGTVTLIR